MALLGSVLWDALSAVVLLTVIAFWFATAEFDFFKKRGIPYVKPLPFVGNFWSVVIGRESMNVAVEPLYQKLKNNRFGGIFIAGSPVVLVCDPEMVKMVLTKDFSSLHDRGIPFDEENDPVSGNLVNIPGPRWKNLRSKLTPTFTSGKLKLMVPLIEECSKNLVKVLEEKAAKGEVVNMNDYLVRYATDAIGTSLFGIECNSLMNPNSEFHTMSRKVFRPSILSSIRFALFSNSKFLSKLLSFKWVFPGVHQFFMNIMKETVNFRKNNNVERNDFALLLMQLQKEDELKTRETHPDEVICTDSVIAAQAVFFFVTGLDGVANAVGFALHHLSLNPRMQDDLADEVISVLNNHDGEFSYEALKEMKMVDRVISESLRMYTAGGVLYREVSAPNYTLPGTDVTLKNGMKVLVPVQGLHYDPDIYPEPTKFDPERFTEEQIAKRHPYTYMPFGEGPRICIAKRFVLLECKLSLASLIKDFRFSVCPETQVPIQLEPCAFGPAPKVGFNLKIEKRKT